MKNKKLIIFGNSPYASMVYDYFDLESDYEVVAFTVNECYISAPFFRDKPVVPFENIELMYSPSEYDMFIAVGSKNLNQTREHFYLEAINKKYSLASFVSPRASIGHKVKVGKNCIIMEGSWVLYNSTIGDDCIVWPGAFISHDNTVYQHSYIVGRTNGFCTIGRNCFIGAGSMIADRVKIASYNFITMSAIINKDTQENSLYSMDLNQTYAKKVPRITAVNFAKLFYDK